jgi:hypothetical protein
MFNLTKMLSGKWVLAAIFIIGLGLRLAGLGFNGTSDVDLYLYKGYILNKLGVDQALRQVGYGYGPLSFAAFGIAAGQAGVLPRFWWVPINLMVILFELVILVLLIRLLPETCKHLVLVMYWINPWFILHGSWHGFWDSPYTAFGLMAIICLKKMNKLRLSWVMAGLLLMIAAMIKPQGMAYFVMPVCIYLCIQVIRNLRLPFIYFMIGSIFAIAVTTGFLIQGGGDLLTVVRSYHSAAQNAPCLNYEAINIWWPISRILQAISGQEGRVFMLQLPEFINTFLHLIALYVVFILIILFSLRIPMAQYKKHPVSSYEGCSRAAIRIVGITALLFFVLGLFRTSRAEHILLIFGRYSLKYAIILGTTMFGGCIAVFAAPLVARWIERFWRVVAGPQNPAPYLSVFLILAFSSLIFPQLGIMASTSHTYGALVLLIPLAIANYRIRFSWIIMIIIHFYCQLARFQLGRNIVVPLPTPYYSPIQSLISQISAAVGVLRYKWLLQFQGRANEIIERLMPMEPVFSVLSVLQFICVVIVIREMFVLAARPGAGYILSSAGDR